MRPSDVIWRHRSGSTLTQVMACCLTAPSHYLNQFGLIISEVQVTFILGQFHKRSLKPSIIKIHLKIIYLKFHSNFPGANELNTKHNVLIRNIRKKKLELQIHVDLIITWPIWYTTISHSVMMTAIVWNIEIVLDYQTVKFEFIKDTQLCSIWIFWRKKMTCYNEVQLRCESESMLTFDPCLLHVGKLLLLKPERTIVKQHVLAQRADVNFQLPRWLTLGNHDAKTLPIDRHVQSRFPVLPPGAR